MGPRRTGSAIRDMTSFVFALTDKDSGKTRYGICVNFYRPIERFAPGNEKISTPVISTQTARGRRNSAFRRESWRKSIEKSSDSAFSRQVVKVTSFNCSFFSILNSCTICHANAQYNSFNSYGLLNSSSDYRSNVAPSDSDRELTSRRDSDTPHHVQHKVHQGYMQSAPTLGLMAPSGDSESGGSHSPSPRASRKRMKLRNQSLTSLCIISHHPFFTTFRECLFILKKLIDACNESSSPKRVGSSQKFTRDNVWTVLAGQATETTSSIVLHDVREIETWILRLLSTPVPVPGSTRIEVTKIYLVNFHLYLLNLNVYYLFRLKFYLPLSTNLCSLLYLIILASRWLTFLYICLWNCWVSIPV